MCGLPQEAEIPLREFIPPSLVSAWFAMIDNESGKEGRGEIEGKYIYLRWQMIKMARKKYKEIQQDAQGGENIEEENIEEENIEEENIEEKKI